MQVLKEKINILTDLLKKIDGDVLINIHNELNKKTNDYIYQNDEEFIEKFFSNSTKYEMLENIFKGDYNIEKEFAKIDALEHLKTYSFYEIMQSMDYQQMASTIIDDIDILEDYITQEEMEELKKTIKD